MDISEVSFGNVPRSAELYRVGDRGRVEGVAGNSYPRGFSLIELLVAIAILAILLGLAAPSFQSIMQGNRVMAVTNDLFASLNYARAEAVKRAANVTVCKTVNPSAANPTCAGAGGWSSGWLVFVDDGAPGIVDGGDLRLQVAQPNGGEGSIVGDAAFADYIQFNSRGAASNGAGGALTICFGGIKRILAVNATGHAKVTPGAC